MRKTGKQILKLGIMLVLLFAVWTVLIQTADVKPVGQNGTNVGFAALNKGFFELTGVHMALYTITDWMGIVPVIICLIFAAVGFAQMIARKSVFKVDYDIILLGFYYIIVIFGYLIFEMIPLNYRPVLIDGRMEASYPSSTTLLVLSVMPAFIFQIKCRLKNQAVKKAAVISAYLYSAVTVTGRLISGVHWLTDIVGGILLSGGLFCVYKGIVLMCSGQKSIGRFF